MVVDYKTDRVSSDSLSAAAQKYTIQLSLYAKALARITGIPIKEKVVFFLAAGKAVPLP